MTRDTCFVVASLVTHVRDDVLDGNVTHTTTVAPQNSEQSTGVRDAGDGVGWGGGEGGEITGRRRCGRPAVWEAHRTC